MRVPVSPTRGGSREMKGRLTEECDEIAVITADPTIESLLAITRVSPTDSPSSLPPSKYICADVQ
jgi:hypothetical protein